VGITAKQVADDDDVKQFLTLLLMGIMVTV
jgi:hypothetical protein